MASTVTGIAWDATWGPRRGLADERDPVSSDPYPTGFFVICVEKNRYFFFF